MKKKILALLLIAIMLVALIPQAALAAGGSFELGDGYILNMTANTLYANGMTISALVTDGSEITVFAGASAKIIGSKNVKINCQEGVTLTLEGVTSDISGTEGASALSFKGSDNTLILTGPNSLKSGERAPGIRVEPGTFLEITDDGEAGEDSLSATGGHQSAGIGGGNGRSGGNITISGGTVNATGGMYAAGIGGGSGGDGGNITISGGTVNARGGQGGAGIGGGIYGDGGSITISGDADVTATAGSDGGAGIGGSYSGNDGGAILITGGTIVAKSSSWGAGIGGGHKCQSGTVVINGGVVCAESIGDGVDGRRVSLNFSGEAMVFFRNTCKTPAKSTLTYFSYSNASGGQLYGITLPSGWPGARLYAPARQLRYDDNGGSGEKVVTTPMGDTLTVAGSDGFSKPGYTFLEWDTQADGEGEGYDPGDSIMMDADKTLYAIWESVAVTGVDIESDAKILSPGGIAALTANVTPSGAADKSLTWTSDNPGVATVDSRGVVTAVSEGSALITAESINDPSYSDTCQIAVSSVLLNYALSTGSVMNMTAAVEPDAAATWKSSDTSVATVDASGKVKALAFGYTKITVTAGPEDGISQTCGVLVYDQTVTSVALNRTSADLTVGDSIGLTAYVDPDDAVNKDVTWTSDALDVVTVNDSGTVTAVGKGSTTVTAQSGGQSASCTIEVTQPVTIATPNLPAGTLGESYSCSLAAGGGDGSNSWYDDGLPQGLSMERDTGEISGKPNKTGDFSLKVTVYDGEGRSAEKTYTLTVSLPSATGKYEITPDNDSAYTVSTADGFTALKIKSGVTGFRYFKVSINPIVAHEGDEACVFVQMRNGVQIGFYATVADFDNSVKATAGFNVKPGDIIKVYIVDALSNSQESNPVLLQ